MNQAIANTVELAASASHQAITMATTNAARVGRIAGRQRGLVPGEKADLVRFSWDPETLFAHHTRNNRGWYLSL